MGSKSAIALYDNYIRLLPISNAATNLSVKFPVDVAYLVAIVSQNISRRIPRLDSHFLKDY